MVRTGCDVRGRERERRFGGFKRKKCFVVYCVLCVIARTYDILQGGGGGAAARQTRVGDDMPAGAAAAGGPDKAAELDTVSGVAWLELELEHSPTALLFFFSASGSCRVVGVLSTHSRSRSLGARAGWGAGCVGKSTRCCCLPFLFFFFFFFFASPGWLLLDGGMLETAYFRIWTDQSSRGRAVRRRTPPDRPDKGVSKRQGGKEREGGRVFK